jgi:hypothetical protein
LTRTALEVTRPVLAPAARRPPGQSTVVALAGRPRSIDPATALALQRSIGNRALTTLIDRQPAGPVVARSPRSTASVRPATVLVARNGDGNGDGGEAKPESWGEWGWRQAKNPWVWVGVGAAALAAYAVYNHESITEYVTQKAIENPHAVSTAAKIVGPQEVAKFVGPKLVEALKEVGEKSITDLTPTQHLTDALKGVVKATVPGGSAMTTLYEVGSKVVENQELVKAGLTVGQDLGPGFVLEVAKEIAAEHGGEITLHGIDAMTKPVIESAAFIYNDPRGAFSGY